MRCIPSDLPMRKSLFSVIVLAAAAAAAACGSDSTTEPQAPTSIDVSTLISQMTGVSATAAATASSATLIGFSFPTPPINPASCPYSASVQGFVCAPITTQGLTFSMTYFLLDASGKNQSAPDPKATASIRTVSDVKGTTTIPSNNGVGGTMVVDDHQEMTMSGLLTTTHTLNGTSKSRYDITLTGTNPLKGSIDMTATTSNVVVPLEAGAYPKSGTITNDMKIGTAIGPTTVTSNAKSVITFNGTSIVTVVSTVDGRVQTCKIDLTGKTAPVC
jgi:hypothetical protein